MGGLWIAEFYVSGLHYRDYADFGDAVGFGRVTLVGFGQEC